MSLIDSIRRTSKHLGSVPAGVLAISFVFLLFGCGGAADVVDGGEVTEDRPTVGADGGERASSEVGASGGPEGPPRVLFLGTSLTAGYGLAKEAAYPARLADLLQARGLPIEVVNAGVSGDTSAGGLERLGWLLREPPDWIFVELGANDGLRGLPVEMTTSHLREVIEQAEAVGARAILAGMLMPPNYGEEYTRDFAAIFPSVAEATGALLVPFLLEGVAGDPSLNLADGVHPNPEGHERIAEHLLPFFVEALEEHNG